MQPISSRLFTFIGSAGAALSSRAKALPASITDTIRSIGRALPSSTLARFSIGVGVAVGLYFAITFFRSLPRTSPAATPGDSQCRESDVVPPPAEEGVEPSAGIPEKPVVPVEMTPEVFRQKLNNRTLPNGPILVIGDLRLTDNDALANLPEELTVRGSLFLTGFGSLTSLPAGLTVSGHLDLLCCTSLTSLPERLSVGGYLNLSQCTSLMSLPGGLTLGGGLYLNYCTSLTSLPNWITELGTRGDGQVREVELAGTGLSDALIDRLMSVEAPGMLFHFSRQATPVVNAFTSVDAAIAFWKALVEGAPSISLSLEAGEVQDLINFLTRLKETAEYKNILARSVLAKRICYVLKKMENQEFKENASLIIHQGLSTCHDRIISALDELDLMLQVKEAEEGGKREELRALGRGMLMLEEVQKAALAHTRTLTWVDEIEIQLAFQIGLKDHLKLPLSTSHMIFRGCAHVSDEKIQQVGAEIERRVSDEVVDAYLLTWAPWQKLLRREAFDALKPEFQEAPTDLEWNCCLSSDELTEGYLFGGNLYDRESLRTVYVDKGIDPFTKVVIELAEVKKVVKPVPES